MAHALSNARFYPCYRRSSPRFCRPVVSASFPRHTTFFSSARRLQPRHRRSHLIVCRERAIGAVGSGQKPISASDKKPYAYFRKGKTYYLDVLDVFSFLATTVGLIPINPESYNPAAYLWKKIADIPEERRSELLQLLDPRLISKAWDIAGARYLDANLAKRCASKLLSNNGDAGSLELWACKKSGGPILVTWMTQFKMALFRDKDESTYGRFFGLPRLFGVSERVFPLYFMVREAVTVMASEENCDFAFELGNGIFDVQHRPDEFPKPAKHPPPFDDEVVVYVRHLGPGVMVGQAWREGKATEQLPCKFCGEILMVTSNITFSIVSS